MIGDDKLNKERNINRLDNKERLSTEISDHWFRIKNLNSEMDRVDLDLLGSRRVPEFDRRGEEGVFEHREDGWDWMKVVLVKRTEVIVRGGRR